MIGLSDTPEGVVMDHVCKFLGYQPGKFYSEVKYATRLLIRELQTGWVFCQLNWVLDEHRRMTIIFCHTIGLEFNVKVYPWCVASSRDVNPKKLDV
jgi:hypothetical protein